MKIETDPGVTTFLTVKNCELCGHEHRQMPFYAVDPWRTDILRGTCTASGFVLFVQIKLL